jgi:hypothetical protein
MRWISVGIGILAVGWVSPAAGKRPKGKLQCSYAPEGDKPVKVPSKRLRLDGPVKCTLGFTASDPTLKAKVQTHWTDLDDNGKKVKMDGLEHTGAVAADKPVDLTLEEGKDFSGCVDFTIDAAIVDAQGKAAGWKQSTRVKQFCPD